MATARTTTTARRRAESEVGPFGAGATRVADVNSIKSLIEMTAVRDDFEPNDRKTREVDPAHFRALLLLQEEAAPAAAASHPEPAAEPPKPTGLEDDLDAAFADPDAGALVASPAAPSMVAEAVEADAVKATEVAVRKPARAAALPVLPARGPSARTLVIASVALLAIAALIFVVRSAF